MAQSMKKQGRRKSKSEQIAGSAIIRAFMGGPNEIAGTSFLSNCLPPDWKPVFDSKDYSVDLDAHKIAYQTALLLDFPYSNLQFASVATDEIVANADLRGIPLEIRAHLFSWLAKTNGVHLSNYLDCHMAGKIWHWTAHYSTSHHVGSYTVWIAPQGGRAALLIALLSECAQG